MYQLSDTEIDYIQADLVRRGVRTESIRDNLLDHICILLENQLQHGEDFERLYSEVLGKFDELSEIEAEARILTLSRNHITITKLQFFVLLLILLISPFLTYLLNNAQSGFSKNVYGPALAYLSWPLCSLLVIFLIPERLDPPIRKHARIMIGLKPLVLVINK